MKLVQNTGNKIIVIADDFTGASDTGVQFAKQGLKTTVLLNADSPLGDLIEEDVLVVNTQSRSLSPDAAYQKVAKSAGLVNNSRFNTLFKKIDSTLRGNIGREIDAVMDTCNLELAIVAPAFPKNGRITVGGYHLLQGVPLEDTEMACDRSCPISESHLPTLLLKQTSRNVGHVGIKAVMAGPEGILSAMSKMLAAGIKIIVCDVWREEHFQNIAIAATQLEKSVLWVGSAGLAEYLPSVFRMNSATICNGPVVVLAGSVSTVTREQVVRLRQKNNITYIEVDTSSFLRHETTQIEIQRCYDAAIRAITAGNDILIVSGYSDDIVEKTTKKGLTVGFSSRQTAEAVAATLGDLCRQIAATAKLGGLVLTGGDVALSCCSALSATGFSVVEEIAPGIPLGLLKGGPCDGLRVVTKAGAFGAEDALCRAVECLK